MSECNLCRFAQLKQRTKKENKIIVKRPSTGGLGGVDVFVLNKEEALDREKHFVAWYMELPKECRC